MVSGIQHFAFCRRQWALMHIEGQWTENYFTASGSIFHERTHDPAIKESRKDCLSVRGLPISSAVLGLSGECDVVEFHRSAKGISLKNRDGLWQPFPFEYKRGTDKEDSCDALQLCAQAMCLEEMLCCTIPAGALFYGELQRRIKVIFSDVLREEVKKTAEEMHRLYRHRHTPLVKASKRCKSCSLKDVCLSTLSGMMPVSSYFKKALEDEQ